jgi:hypothetical protein
MEPSDRYDGMRLAFGENTEIFKPYRPGDLTPEVLDAAALNKLLISVEKRFSARDNKDNTQLQELVSNDRLRYHRKKRLWNRAIEQKYGKLRSWLYGLVALLPPLVLSIVKTWKHEKIIPEVLWGGVFLVLKWYSRRLLNIHREICYIKVARHDLKLSGRRRWRRLRERALDGPPEPPGPPKPPGDGEVAVEDIKFGHIRHMKLQGVENLLAPVVSVMPTLKFDSAQGWFILRSFRGPLLTCSYIFAGDTDHHWPIVFAICVLVQASLQNDCAKVFLAHTQTYEVNWFRRIKREPYAMEYDGYRRDPK